MTVVGGLGSLILADGKLAAGQLLVVGAAFPTLFKELVASAHAGAGPISVTASPDLLCRTTSRQGGDTRWCRENGSCRFSLRWLP